MFNNCLILYFYINIYNVRQTKITIIIITTLFSQQKKVKTNASIFPIPISFRESFSNRILDRPHTQLLTLQWGKVEKCGKN